MVEGCNRLKRAPLVALVALVSGGCATTATQDRAPGGPAGGRVPDTRGAPAAQAPLSAAGAALLVQSRNERRSGDYAQASSTLERALRIEPAAPSIWLELARVRLLEGNYAQAEQLARKAQSLAVSDDAIASEAGDIIAETLDKQNRH
ncbi:MAG TPA: tetratricopeptide repeat protein [Woeseiaceae bacterium]|jgi:tetratricopeptide (TPR) repeat protein|nr:tetratricopeptide repeat protein [Woeseiaceae bacterium]